MSLSKPWLLAAALAWLGACSNKTSDTKLMVVVSSNLTVPTEMDRIRVDVIGTSPSPATEFPLTASHESGKTTLPVVLEIVSPDSQARELRVTASGFQGMHPDPIVSRTANLKFDPGRTHVLTLFLDSACAAPSSCDPVTVDVTTLPIYDPKNFPPDAGAVIGSDGGISAETGGLDASADARQTGDAAVDQPVAGPDAGTDAAAEALRGFDASSDTFSDAFSDAPSDSPADAPPDLAVPEDAAPDVPLPDAPEIGDDAGDGPALALDTGMDAPAEAPKGPDAYRDTPADRPSDAPPDLAPANDTPPDLAAPDGASACVLPMTTCPGGCINPQTSIGNCGGCGQACGSQNGTPACAAGVCSMSACSTGFLDCSTDENTSRNGCETNVTADSANCGRCGKVCSSLVCRNQTCLTTTKYGNIGAGSSTSPFSQDFLAGIAVDIPVAGVVTGLGAVLYDATTTCHMYLGLYKDVAGNPGALVATVAAPALVAPGGKELSVNPPVDVPAGTYWILGVWDDTATFSSNSSSTVVWRFVSYTYAALPASAPVGMDAYNLPPPNLYVIVAQ